MLKGFRSALGVEEDEERGGILGGSERDGWGLSDDNCFSLSWKERMIGFAVCAGLAVLLGFLSFFLLAFLIAIKLFALTYSLANLCLLTSTFFLVGPMRQLKSMFSDTSRGISAVVFFIALILTFVAAAVIDSLILAIFMVIIQFCAFTWYSLSYIPFAQTAVLNCCKGLISG
eukprot:TRINITY_DN3998_c0_g1_i1.p1 TRINITY_DN3998_c0_g1~~TRINITY_DN3998_c0_g1_i1.p1  ORF type:complete len:173 (-),score=42.86 TRINITY_DN3998_c0_g1_i1:15-533(-)